MAIALAESGLLERLVTDAYGTKHFANARFNADIDPRSVVRVHRAAVRQLLPRLPITTATEVDWGAVHRDLGRTASALAQRTGAGLLAYSGGTAQEAFAGASDRPRILFVFHPLPIQEHEALTADAEFCRTHGVTPQVDSEDAVKRNQQIHDEELLMADLVLTASEFTSSGVRKRLRQLGRQEVPVQSVPYGTQLPPENQLTSTTEHQGPVEFLFLGQGIQRKGLHHLLIAWHDLDLGASEARLNIVAGHWDPGLKELLAGLPGVRQLPRVSDAHLHHLMATSDVLALPSLVEGFGLVITEALAHGLHVISTTNTGLPDLQPSTRAAQIVAPGSQSQLKSAIERALNPQERSRAESVLTAREWPWERFRIGVSRAVECL